MSRDLMDESYYTSHGGMIPVKWTAPEVTRAIAIGRALPNTVFFRLCTTRSIHPPVTYGVLEWSCMRYGA